MVSNQIELVIIRHTCSVVVVFDVVLQFTSCSLAFTLVVVCHSIWSTHQLDWISAAIIIQCTVLTSTKSILTLIARATVIWTWDVFIGNQSLATYKCNLIKGKNFKCSIVNAYDVTLCNYAMYLVIIYNIYISPAARFAITLKPSMLVIKLSITMCVNGWN